MNAPTPTMAAQLLVQLQAHREGARLAVGFGTGLVLLLVVALAEHIALPRLAAWLALAVVAAGLSLRATRHDGDAAPSAPEAIAADLRRHRIALLSRGLAWGLAGVLLWPADETGLRGLLVLVLATSCTVTLALVAADLTAASGFATLALAPVALRLMASGSPHYALMALSLAMLVAATAAVNRRARSRALRQAAELDSREARIRSLHRSEQQLAEAEHLASLGSFDWDPVSGALHWSDQHYRLWGYEPGSVVPSYEVFRRGIHHDDVDRLEAVLQAALAGGQRYDFEHRVRWPDGTERNIRARGEVFFAADGRALRMIGAVQDITERVQAETRLRMNAFVLDAIADPVSMIDDQQRYRLVNAAWCQANDRTPADALNSTFDDVYPQVFSLERRAAMRRAADLGEAQTVRGPSPSVRSRHRQIETRYFPFRDANVPWHGVVMVSRDVTEAMASQAALAASLENLRLTLNTIGDAIFATDAVTPDDPVLFANDQLLQMWGIPPAEALPLTATKIIQWAVKLMVDPDAQVARIRAIIAGNEAAEDRVELTDGRVLLRRCSPTARAGRQVRVWGFRDITAETRATRSLQAAKDEAERANRAKSQFLSTMSHELRTPLNAVIGFSQVLEHTGTGKFEPRQMAQVREIRKAGQHLLSLINDLLDLARIEAGRTVLELEPVALAPLVDECLRLVEPLATRRQARLIGPPAADCRVAVRADRMRLKQVLLNLLSNAIKYNRQGGRVELRCVSDGRRVRLEVHDEGPGIDAEGRARLFQVFERLNADAGGTEGTGIGLALSLRLMRLMDGQLDVDSQPGVGSCFWLALPIVDTPDGPSGLAPGGFVDALASTGAQGAPVEAALPHEPQHEPLLDPLLDDLPAPAPQPRPALPGPDPATVLYIDDNPVNLALMEGLLEERADLRLVCTDQPEQGLEAARRELPSLVLVDLQMPRIDGVQVLRQLRQDERTRDIPVVAISAYPPSEMARRCAEDGFAGYLGKPLDLGQLQALLDRTLATPPA